MGLFNRRTCDERKIEKILETDVETGGGQTERNPADRKPGRERQFSISPALSLRPD